MPVPTIPCAILVIKILGAPSANAGAVLGAPQQAQATPVARAENRHAFWDKLNIGLTVMEAGAMLFDGITTQHIKHRYPGQAHEADPIAAPFVNRGWPGMIAGGALFVATEEGAAATPTRFAIEDCSSASALPRELKYTVRTIECTASLIVTGRIVRNRASANAIYREIHNCAGYAVVAHLSDVALRS